ncbi:hypothetical protein ANN_18935 [Periplaneta americana]|uniref:DUF4817 domain-containing protein n=1 Tax=Periplaneta americana TaxID=6978 RepID=A0ABQ8SQ41_PERAM|nr:hypothetical protein ANN_18935 [Periplaneta americana]
MENTTEHRIFMVEAYFRSGRIIQGEYHYDVGRYVHEFRLSYPEFQQVPEKILQGQLRGYKMHNFFQRLRPWDSTDNVRESFARPVGEVQLAGLSGTRKRSLPSKETLRGHSDSSFRGEGYIQCCVGVRLCDMYSNQELAEIHFMYGKADGNAALARRLYQERYPQRQCPDRKTFVRLHYRLCEYGKFNSPGLGRGRPRSTTPEVQEEILEAVNMTPSISTRRVALQVNVPHTTVWRLLKEYQFYPYHLQRVQALSPADYPARVKFCAVLLNMWAGIIGDRLVGPHVLVNRLTGQAYTNFLENTIPHILEDTPLINRQHIHFLHDGAPAHFSRTARRYLDRKFPDRWIGRSGPIAWPPRSPDLNPLDFYLWGHLKSLVYSSPVPVWNPFGIELWHVLRTYAILLEFGIVFAGQ